MYKLNEYLPKPSEYSDKVSETLNYSNMYLVGSAARKYLYGLPSNPADYDVIVSSDDALLAASVFGKLEETFSEKKIASKNDEHTVDCEVFTLKVRTQPIDKFLRNVLFAGDGMAIHVESGRVITLPEFITLAPMTPVRRAEQDEAQIDPEYLKRHLAVLEKFTEEMIKFSPKTNESGTS